MGCSFVVSKNGFNSTILTTTAISIIPAQFKFCSVCTFMIDSFN